jgi:hypothetical protein
MEYPERLKPQIEQALRSPANQAFIERVLQKVRGELAKFDPDQPDAFGSANPGVHDDEHHHREFDRMREAESLLVKAMKQNNF